MEFNIRFRAFEKSDAIFINKLRNDDEREKKIGGSKRYISLERDEKWVSDIIMNDLQHVMYFAITEINHNEIIGYISISDIDYRNGTCTWNGLKLSPTMSGKGYGIQASLLLIKFIFEEMRMVRCQAECQADHEVSLNMIQKAGFQKEGLLRKNIFKNGQHLNTWLLSILDTDYLNIKYIYKK